MANDGPFLAALDYGTGGGKCAIFDPNGERMAVSREAWTYDSIPHEHQNLAAGSGFDPHAFWAALCRCIRVAVEEAGIEVEEIAAVAATAQRLGTVFLDARGREIYAAPNIDGRGIGGGFEVMEKMDVTRAMRLTGHWPPMVSSLARLLRYGKLDGQARVAYVLTLSDWITYRLSGVLTSEPSNAAESMLLDISSRNWSREIIETFKLDERILPPIVEAGTPVGRVTHMAAEQTGLSAGTPVIAGGADTQCALLGSGVVQAGQAGAVLGTTTPIMVVESDPRYDESGSLWAGCHVVPDRWTLESNAGETGIGYDWLLGIVGLQGDEMYERAEALIDAAPQDAGSVMSFAGPQIFDLLNYEPDRPAAFLFDKSLYGTRPTSGSFLSAFLFSVVWATRANLEQVEARRSAPALSLTLSGGMTRMPSLLDRFRRSVRHALHVSEEPHATALGAALLAAVGAGVHDSISTAAERMVRTRPLEQAPLLSDEAEAGYARWRKRYPQLSQLSG